MCRTAAGALLLTAASVVLACTTDDQALLPGGGGGSSAGGGTAGSGGFALPLGAVCSQSSACASGHCTDGVCCAVAECGQAGDCEVCATGSGQCVAIAEGPCDDGHYCNGTDTCSPTGCDVHSGDPCTGADGDEDCAESCNDEAGSCMAPDPAGTQCDDGLCDGAGQCALGSCIWQRTWEHFHPRGVAMDGDGAVLVTGDITDSVDLGCGSAPFNVAEPDVVVGKLDPSGACLWQTSFKDIGVDAGRGIAVDASGNVLVAGQIGGTLTAGCEPLEWWGGGDALLVKLDAAGTCLWATGATGDVTPREARAVAADAAGNSYIVGAFMGHMNVGCGDTYRSSHSAYVAKFDPAGNCVWFRAGTADAWSEAHTVAVLSSGGVVVGGQVGPDVDFGCGPVDLSSASWVTAFVATFDSSGACVWQRYDEGATGSTARAVAVDGGGAVVVAGEATGPLDFGCGPTPADTTAAFVAQLTASGECAWQRRTDAGVGMKQVNGVALDAASNVVATGEFVDAIDFGCGALEAPSSIGAFVAKLGAQGDCLWQRRAGVGTNQEGEAVALDGAGSTLVAGRFAGVLDFGCGEVPSTVPLLADGFVAKLGP